MSVTEEELLIVTYCKWTKTGIYQCREKGKVVNDDYIVHNQWVHSRLDNYEQITLICILLTYLVKFIFRCTEINGICYKLTNN